MQQFPPTSGVPPLTTVARANVRDPRVRTAAPYQPVIQADQQQIAQVQSHVASSVPFDEVLNRLDNLNNPPQLHMAPFLINFTAIQIPQLLLPHNPRRMAFMVINPDPTATIAFSFDQPVGKDASGLNLGLNLPGVGFYQESNGTVSVNDIWVWATSLAGLSSIYCLGYEGTLSVSGKFGGTQSIA